MRPPSRIHRRSLTSVLPAALAALVAAPVLALVPAPAPASAGADYEPVDPPYVQQDKAGDATVLRKRLARTDLTRREAKAADFTRVRYTIEDHDAERSARIAVQMRRVLPDRPGRHTQHVQVYFDEETFIDTDVHSGVSRYRSSYGGPGSEAPGCRILDAETDGRTVVQWIPVRCLLSDTSEMYVSGVVYATAPETDAGRRLVGLDSAVGTAPFIRWR